VIGNDLVVWQALPGKSEERWQRYANRILHPSEQPCWQKLNLPSHLIMLWWAAKEASYKSWRASGGARLFQPKSFVLQNLKLQENEACFTVEKEGQFSEGQTEFNTKYLFSRVWPQGRSQNMVSQLGTDTVDPSAQMRTNLLENLATKHGWGLDRLSCRQNQLGVPVAYLDQKPLPLSLSFSHHGTYWAYSYVYRQRP
jgi:phosphopantetheinyl transferase (holo-ACP synthase)